MAHGAYSDEVILHGKVYIACAGELSCPWMETVCILITALLINLFHSMYDAILMVE